MPQTLLALLALAAASFFTLSQKQASTHTVETIVLDEFEVAVAGALLHTTEFADSRAFDDATTPEQLRIRLGLPQNLTQTTLDTLTASDIVVPTSLFIDPSRMGLSVSGAVTRCNAVDQLASTNCDDVSDFNDRAAGTWRNVTLETPNGDPLPVEVHVEVHYVEAANPDVIVNRRTNHKRVDVWARSPLLIEKYPNHTVVMRRVISFNPETALEYLKRMSCVASPSQSCSPSTPGGAPVYGSTTTAETAR